MPPRFPFTIDTHSPSSLIKDMKGLAKRGQKGNGFQAEGTAHGNARKGEGTFNRCTC